MLSLAYTYTPYHVIIAHNMWKNILWLSNLVRILDTLVKDGLSLEDRGNESMDGITWILLQAMTCMCK